MLIKITKGGRFSHPDTRQWDNQLTAATDEIVDLEDAWGEFIIGMGRAERVDAPKEPRIQPENGWPRPEIEVPPTPECVEDPTPPEEEEKPKRKPRRKAGQKKGTK